MDILVRLGDAAVVLPGNGTLIWDAAVCLASALEGVIPLLGAVDP